MTQGVRLGAPIPTRAESDCPLISGKGFICLMPVNGRFDCHDAVCIVAEKQDSSQEFVSVFTPTEHVIPEDGLEDAGLM